jgi:hypothetical protein
MYFQELQQQLINNNLQCLFAGDPHLINTSPLAADAAGYQLLITQ